MNYETVLAFYCQGDSPEPIELRVDETSLGSLSSSVPDGLEYDLEECRFKPVLSSEGEHCLTYSLAIGIYYPDSRYRLGVQEVEQVDILEFDQVERSIGLIKDAIGDAGYSFRWHESYQDAWFHNSPEGAMDEINSVHPKLVAHVNLPGRYHSDVGWFGGREPRFGIELVKENPVIEGSNGTRKTLDEMIEDVEHLGEWIDFFYRFLSETSGDIIESGYIPFPGQYLRQDEIPESDALGAVDIHVRHEQESRDAAKGIKDMLEQRGFEMRRAGEPSEKQFDLSQF